MEIEPINLHNFIKIYDDVLRKDSLENFVKICNEKKEFVDAPIVGPEENPILVNKKVRDVKVWELGNVNQKFRTDVYWANYFCNIFTQHINKYENDIGMLYKNNTKVSAMQVLKYENHGHYTYHVDHNRAIPRTISCIYFVNDNYEGGELFFKFLGSMQEIKIEKKANRLIVWPSNFLFPHMVKKVDKGIRYSVVAWAL